MGKEFDTSLDVLFGKVDELVSTKTVVGDAIVTDGLTILPLIEVGVGVGLGGKESGSSAGGMGARITPSAVLVIQDGNVQIMHIKHQDAICKLIDMAPGVVDKLNFGAIFSDRNKTAKTEVSKEEAEKFEEQIVVED